MAKIKVGVVEDEMIIAQGIVQTLKSLDYLVTEPAISYTEALGMIVSEHPDIVLLDIQLKGHKDGIELAEKIKEDYNIPFIFLTANADAATVDRAKKLNPHAYLVKPFSKEELYAAIEICLHNFSTTNNKIQPTQKGEFFIKDCLFLRQGPGYQKVKLDDIIYIESSDVYINVTIPGSKLLVRNSIQNFLEQIGAPHFLRVHKSFAVNANHIDSISSDSLFMGGKEIPIGRAYRDDLMSFLQLD